MKFTSKFTAPAACSELSQKDNAGGPARSVPRRLGLNREAWTYGFKAEGRRYSLVKRNRSADGAWWVDCVIDGQRVTGSTQTNVAAAAAQRAWSHFIQPARQGRWEAVRRRPGPQFAPLGVVLQTYVDLSVGKTAPATVTNNLNAFRLVVRRGLGDDNMTLAAVDALSSAVLTGKLVGEFEEWMGRAALAHGRDLESNKRSVAGYLRHARSVFNRAIFPRYEEKDVRLPDLTPFLKRAVSKAVIQDRVPPPPSVLAATLAAAERLRAEDRAAYVAWLLAFSTLRRGEISKMRWSWIEAGSDGTKVRVPRKSKGKREAVLPLDALVARELEAYRGVRCQGLCPEEEAYVLPSPRVGQGGPEAKLRAQSIFLRVNAWMRGLGWTSNHTLHEMRALTLSQVRDEFGLDSAQALGRHSDQRTTQQSYVGQKSLQGVVVKLPLAFAPAGGAEVGYEI